MKWRVTGNSLFLNFESYTYENLTSKNPIIMTKKHVLFILHIMLHMLHIITHTLRYEVAKSALLEWLLNDFTGQKTLHFVSVVFPQ